MRVAIVGGAGYVGSVLAPELELKGHEVVVYDNLMYGQMPASVVIKADARNCVPAWFEGCDAVVNLAGFSNDPVAESNPSMNWDLNVAMAARIAAAAEEAGVRRLVYASSASVYHSGKSVIDGELGEDFPVSPVFHYSCSKFAGEIASRCFKRMAVCVLRKGTISGPSPRMRYDLLANTMFRSAMRDGKIELHGGGTAWRPLLSIDDAVSAYIDVIEADESLIRGEIFNVCSWNGKVKDCAYYVASALGDSEKLHVDLIKTPGRAISRSYKISSRHLQEKLGWEPKHNAYDITDHLLRYHQGKLGYAPAGFGDPRTENVRYLERELA